MSSKIYLVGTAHVLPFDALIKNKERLYTLMGTVDVIIKESPISTISNRNRVKAPGFCLGLWFYACISIISGYVISIISGKGIGDNESIKNTLTNRIKRAFIEVKLEQLKTNTYLNSDKVKIVRCFDLDINDYLSAKGKIYSILNYLVFVFIFIPFLLAGIGALLKLEFVTFIISVIMGFMILFGGFVFPFVQKTLKERNNVAIDFCKNITIMGYKNIFLVYGKAHIKDLSALLKNQKIECEIV
jgi:hypothetical protein